MFRNTLVIEMLDLPKKSFMAHVYCGDPSLEESEKIIHTLLDNGVDILELGIPFSDPIADGPVFQKACQRSLAAGTKPDDVFALVKRLKCKVPIILTTYYNIIYQKGIVEFVELLVEHEIQGVIVPDLPMEESHELREECMKNDIHLIYLIAPTASDERIEQILGLASGFVYLVGITGVTGAEHKIHKRMKDIVKKIKSQSSLPVLLGFGISKPEQLKELDYVDGYIIGSEICRLYQKGSVGKFARAIKAACK